MHRARVLLEQFLENTKDTIESIDAMIYLSVLLINYAMLKDLKHEFTDAIKDMEHATDLLEQVYKAEHSVTKYTLEHAKTSAETLVQSANTDRDIKESNAIYLRITALGLSEDPKIRDEQIFWRNLRNFVLRMKRLGVSDETLAETFLQAIRSDGGNLSPELLAVPEIGGLAKALAERAAKYTTFIVMAPMTLDMARIQGDIDQALAQLEALCISYIQSGEDY
jgi:hypothetical protein